jgi:hypothetical protein
MQRNLSTLVIIGLILVLSAMASCGTSSETPSEASVGMLLPMASDTNLPSFCTGCAQATLAALQTQEKNGADAQAAATAEIMRANAQATLDAVSSTLSAAQTQEQNKANIITAQLAATAAIVSANAQATLNSARATQNAALTQDAIRQTQVQISLQVTAAFATQNAIATLAQQNLIFIADSTQTAVADHIATQTQSAIATNQWYTKQARQRNDQLLNQLSFLWMICLPLILIIIAIILFIFFWRWMKIRETQQLIDLNQEILQSNRPFIIDHELPTNKFVEKYLNPTSNPTDHVDRWMEEVKNTLLNEQKDIDDHPGS